MTRGLGARELLTAGLLAAVVACAPKGGAVPPPTLSSVIDGQMTSSDALAWSASRPLTWDDFRGTPPPAPGDEGARTAYSLFYGANCTGRRFEFRVIAAVLPRDSWVTAAVLKTPALNARSLRHEQTHFDLSEVHARKMRQFFRELATPCNRSEMELDSLAQRFAREEATTQRRYDDETNYGRIAAKQTEWDTETARQIARLAEYEAR